MIAEYTTVDGYTLRVYGSGFMEYGLSIERNGIELFNHESYLSDDGWGLKHSNKYSSLKEAWSALYTGEDEEPFDNWTEQDWVDALKSRRGELMLALRGGIV